ncbi:MAG: hypothetical protein JSV92_01615 [archaeon]|nr:MAG: hypothetical protein JSV92_01615 [archaeon]
MMIMSLMLAQTVSLTELNLYDLIFKTILKLPQCQGDATWGCINGVFAHDFIFAFFIPHLVLLIFLFIATKGIGHKGLEALLGIGVYIFIVYSGWYAFFASLTIIWMIVSLFIASFYFFWGRIVHPTRSRELFKMGYERAKKSKEKRLTEEALISDIKYLERQLNEARRGRRTEEIKAISEELTKRRMQLKELQRR